jgi:hypothetical protein
VVQKELLPPGFLFAQDGLVCDGWARIWNRLQKYSLTSEGISLRG